MSKIQDFFHGWCLENLSEEESNGILSRWDYKMNVKNSIALSPKDVTRCSTGFNGKGYWFKCPNHPEHESEQKNISSLTSGKQRAIDCRQCNSLAMTRPDLVRYLVDMEDSLKYSLGTVMKIPMKCPDCKYLKRMSLNSLSKSNRFGCPRCSDGVSYPEKFMFNVLEQLSISFEIQLSKTTFIWYGKAKYDFYLNKFNCIIEANGSQHYQDTSGDWKNVSLIKTQNNDEHKEQLARGKN